MTSVGSNLNIFYVDVHMELRPPLPQSACVHLSLAPLPLRVDVINGWPLTLGASSPSQTTESPSFNDFNRLRTRIHAQYLQRNPHP